MKLRKYISRQTILRIVLIFIILCSATVFDIVFDTSLKGEKTTKEESNQATHFATIFFYNSGNSFKISKGVDRFFQKLLFSTSKNEFLEKYHNFRDRHIIKVEELTKKPSFFSFSHFMKFNVCHQSPGENPLS